MKKGFIVTLVLVVCCLMVTSSWAARKIDITAAIAKGYIGQLNQGVAMAMVLAMGMSPFTRWWLLKIPVIRILRFSNNV